MQPCTEWAPISLQERTNAGYGVKIIAFWGNLAARAGIIIFWIFALSILIAPRAVYAAKIWQAAAGAQSSDEGIQALAFLPNELWIHTGDSITWTFPTPEIHTVTFLRQDTTPEQCGRLAQAPEGAVVLHREGRRPINPASMAQLA